MVQETLSGMAPCLCSPAQEILIFTESRVLGKTKIVWGRIEMRFISPRVVWLSCLLQAPLRSKRGKPALPEPG